MKSKPRKTKLSATLSATPCSVPHIHFHHHRHKPQIHSPGFGETSAKAEQEEVKIGSFDLQGTLSRGSLLDAARAVKQLTPSQLSKRLTTSESIRKRCMNNSHPAAPQAFNLVGTTTEQLNLLAFDDKDFLTSTSSISARQAGSSTRKFHQHLY